MKIDHIIARNIKGRNFNQKLEACTVFYGTSFSGKTAYLDAIKLALLGRHPELGARNQDTFQLCSGSELEVVWHIGNLGQRRQWTSKNGSVKYEGVTEDSVQPKIPDVLLDLNSYLSMTERERMEHVASKVDGGEGLRTRIDHIAVAAKDNEVGNAAKKAWRDLRTERQAAALEEDVGDLALVTDLIEKCKERERTARAELKRMAATGEGMTVLKADGVLQVDRSTDIARAEAERQKAIEARTNDVALEEQLQRLYAQRKEAESTLAVIEQPATAQDRKRIQNRVEELGASIDNNHANVPEAELSHKNQMRELATQRGSLTAIETEAVDLKRKIEDIEHQTSCPYCKSKAKGWKAKLMEDYQTKLKRMDENMATMSQLVHKAIADEERLAKLLVEERRKASLRTDWTNSLTVAKRQLSELPSEDRAKELRARMVTIADTIRQMPVAGYPAAEHDRKLNDIRTRLDALTAEQRRYVMERAKDQTAHEANQRRLTHEAYANVFSEAATLLAEIQSEEIERRVDSLMAVARRFTDGILRGRLEYREGSFGYTRTDGPDPGLWVSHETFSGTEKALAYAGICVALAQESPIKIVLIDELGVMDDERKGLTLVRMNVLSRQGVIDQFVGCDMMNSEIPGITYVEVK